MERSQALLDLNWRLTSGDLRDMPADQLVSTTAAVFRVSASRSSLRATPSHPSLPGSEGGRRKSARDAGNSPAAYPTERWPGPLLRVGGRPRRRAGLLLPLRATSHARPHGFADRNEWPLAIGTGMMIPCSLDVGLRSGAS